MKKTFVAAVALSALTLRAGAASASEFTTAAATTTLTPECLTAPNLPCDPPGRESSSGTLSRSASKGGTEVEKFAVLLLELGAAGWVLLRPACEANGRRTAVRSGNEPDEASSGFRAL